MTAEERIRFLLRVARRVEVEGNQRAARVYRRMADEARPVEPAFLMSARWSSRAATD